MSKSTEEWRLTEARSEVYAGIDKMIAQDKHYGKYIALDGKKIIAYNKHPGKLIEKVRKMGIETPVIVFVQDPKITYIFNVA